MKKLFNICAIFSTLTSFAFGTAEGAIKKQVAFASENQTLAGTLFLPNNYKQGEKLPGVVVTGAWTTVKEQMPTTYAAKLAERGFAALVFDFRGWGASNGLIKFLEDPARKTQDIHAAVDFLATRQEVDSSKISGLGICASAGYMSDAAAQNPKIKSFALVAPWLHDSKIVEQVYGGAESVNSLKSAAIDAKNSAEPVYLEAASLTNENAVMYNAPYYTEKNRGLIAEYDNKFNAASWEGWLNYDALKTAEKQSKPAILIHSESAAIPEGAKQYAKRAGDNVQLIMLENVTQFDFYDEPQAVDMSVEAVVKHFAETLQ